MTSDEWDTVCFIEQHFEKHDAFPRLRTIAQGVGITQVRASELMNSPVVQKALDNRGIEWRPVDPELLSAEQLALIQVLLDISDKRTIKEKLRGLGISYVKYHNWRKHPKFQEAYTKAGEALYGASLPQVHQSVIAEATSGSFPHQKLVLAMTGRWDEKKNSEQLNVRYILMKVLEIIQTHVDDADTLTKIAGEFETILNPQAATAKAEIETPEHNQMEN